jgi:biopolymer transport protein ExbB
MQDQIVQNISTIDFIKGFFSDGGVFMFAILFVWVTGIALALYKFFMLKLYSVNGNRFFDSIKGSVLENKVEAAINNCSNTVAILPRIVKAGLKRANQPREAIEDAVGSSLLENTPKITYQLNYISLCANVSTLLGLLGTIQGLIVSFAGVAGADPGEKAKLLAEGIAKAMNTTAFGLISAITIMVLHAILASKSQRLNDSIDEISAKLVDLLSIKKQKG